MSESPTVNSVASPPFNRNDADIIFQTSDGVTFRLHKQTLLMSSPILEKVINEFFDAELGPSIIQTLEVPEPAATLDSLFRYCYPVVDPEPTTLEEVQSILDAATTYGILPARQHLERHLLTYIADMPLQVYAIACKNGFASIALQAAAAFIASEGAFLAQEYPGLSSIPAHAYWNLVLCFRTSKSPTQAISWSHPRMEPHIAKDQSLNGSDNCNLRWKTLHDVSHSTELSETSWAALPFDVSGTDVIIRSSDGANFKLHKWILSFASPLFRDMFALPQGDANNQDVPVVPVSESGEVLTYLIMLIYPIARVPDIPSLGVVYEALAAAQKYEMETPISIIKDTLNSHILKSPVSIFLIACRYSFDTIAVEAARFAMQKPLLDRTPESHKSVEESIDPRIDVNASVLHRLIQYRTKYLQAMDNTVWNVVASRNKKWSRIHSALKRPCDGRLRSTVMSHQSPWVSTSISACDSSWLTSYGASSKTASKKDVFKDLLEDHDSALIESSFRAGECSECKKNAVIILPLFRRMVLEQIDTTIREISIETWCEQTPWDVSGANWHI